MSLAPLFQVRDHLTSLRLSSIRIGEDLTVLLVFVGVPECNNMENIIFPWQFSRPYLQLGCSLGDALSGEIFMSEVCMLHLLKNG